MTKYAWDKGVLPTKTRELGAGKAWGCGGKGGERGGVRGGRGISHAPQEPKAILPGRGITDAATNDTGLGEIGGKGRLGVVHI